VSDHSDRGYRPVNVADESSNSIFGDSASARRLRRQMQLGGSSPLIEAIEQSLPRPSIISARDAELVTELSWPVFVRTTSYSLAIGAARAAWIVRRHRAAPAALAAGATAAVSGATAVPLRTQLLGVARFWGLVVPFAVSGAFTFFALPAAMFMQGTDMGDLIRRTRARSFGLFGYVDPWAVSLHQINVEEERFAKLAPSLPLRPDVPQSVLTGGVQNREQVDALLGAYLAGVVKRDRLIKEDAMRYQIAVYNAERNHRNTKSYTLRKNDMILRATSQSDLTTDGKLRSQVAKDSKPRQFDDDE
jgi:hypothetical protein